MAKLPQKADSSVRDYVQQSIRFSTAHLVFLEEEAQRNGVSINSVVRDLVTDAGTLYGVPLNMRKKLEEDAKSLGLDRREYIKYLLGLRYEALVRGEVGDRASPRAGTPKKT